MRRRHWQDIERISSPFEKSAADIYINFPVDVHNALSLQDKMMKYVEMKIFRGRFLKVLQTALQKLQKLDRFREYKNIFAHNKRPRFAG
jgi:hypothetical protein